MRRGAFLFVSHFMVLPYRTFATCWPHSRSSRSIPPLRIPVKASSAVLQRDRHNARIRPPADRAAVSVTMAAGAFLDIEFDVDVEAAFEAKRQRNEVLGDQPAFKADEHRVHSTRR